MNPFYLALDGDDEQTIFTDLNGCGCNDAQPVIRRVDLPSPVRHLWDEFARRVTAGDVCTCGHQHTGPDLGGICVGCACGGTS